MDIKGECPYFHQHYLVDKKFLETNIQCQKCCNVFVLSPCKHL